MEFILRHKETNIEIFRMGGYYYERNTHGDYIRMMKFLSGLLNTILKKLQEKAVNIANSLWIFFLIISKEIKK
jgi:hypothetical protein